jgi:hypothetical protein
MIFARRGAERERDSMGESGRAAGRDSSAFDLRLLAFKVFLDRNVPTPAF